MLFGKSADVNVFALFHMTLVKYLGAYPIIFGVSWRYHQLNNAEIHRSAGLYQESKYVQVDYICRIIYIIYRE